jgi:uncharacterized membrane protein YjfL (UPF0719 family)
MSAWQVALVFVLMFVPNVVFGAATPALVPGAFSGALLWGCWYWELASVTRLGSEHRERTLLRWAPVACLLLAAILVIADGEVFLPPVCLVSRLMMWFFWVTLMTQAVSFFGSIPREDVAERNNKAAALAIAGALVAFTLCSALAGHRALVVGRQREAIWSACGACGGLIVIWVIVEAKTRLSETITIDRDASAGWRLTGLLLAAALLCGPGADALVVGDWWVGVVEISGVVVLVVAAVAVERIVQPLRRFRQAGSVGLAFVYVLFAGLVTSLGG